MIIVFQDSVSKEIHEKLQVAVTLNPCEPVLLVDGLFSGLFLEFFEKTAVRVTAVLN